VGIDALCVEELKRSSVEAAFRKTVADFLIALTL
jgi:hypothetical protein